MMINNQYFARTALIPYEEGWGYIWGASGQVWTKQSQENATREQTVKYGSKWIGKRVVDCSGLVLWVAQRFGCSVYHGSNSQYSKNCNAKGKLINGKRDDGQTLKVGTLVFKTKGSDRYHVGVYTGNDLVTEAHGTYQGVIQTSITIWNEWGELSIVDYSGEVREVLYRAEVVTEKGNLNVRDEPNTTDSRVIGHFDRGSIVDVFAEVEGGKWVYASDGKISGYASSKYLKEITPEPVDGGATVEILFSSEQAANAFLAALASAHIKVADAS